MKPPPTQAAIRAAEEQVIRTKADFGDGVQRLQAAFHTQCVKAAGLAVVAGAGGLLYLWLDSRRNPSPVPAGDRTRRGAGMLRALAVQYSLRRLPGFLGDYWSSRQQRPVSGATMPRAGPATGVAPPGPGH